MTLIEKKSNPSVCATSIRNKSPWSVTSHAMYQPTYLVNSTNQLWLYLFCSQSSSRTYAIEYRKHTFVKSNHPNGKLLPVSSEHYSRSSNRWKYDLSCSSRTWQHTFWKGQHIRKGTPIYLLLPMQALCQPGPNRTFMRDKVKICVTDLINFI